MLTGYRALDLTDEKGFLCGKVLGDIGIDVIKIEKPGGDSSRRIGPFYHDDPDMEKSLYWFAYNASKRGITLDIETEQGRDIFKRLVTTADFVIESFPPGYLDDLGLGYAGLSEINPRIILTSISPFGQSGPYRDYKTSDLVTMAMGGLINITGDPDRPPVRIGADQAYCNAGIQAAAGTLIAHYWRELTGEGQQIDVSMQESIVCTLWITLNLFKLNNEVQKREGGKRQRYSIRERVFYECQDGLVSWEILLGLLGASTNALVESMDAKNMAGDLKGIDWKSIYMDAVTQEQLIVWEDLFAEYFKKYTKKELHEEAIKQGTLLMPLNTIGDIAEDVHLGARDFWVEVEHPELGKQIRYPGVAVKNNDDPWEITRRAPLIGEHNRDIYVGEMGFSGQDLATLMQARII